MACAWDVGIGALCQSFNSSDYLAVIIRWDFYHSPHNLHNFPELIALHCYECDEGVDVPTSFPWTTCVQHNAKKERKAKEERLALTWALRRSRWNPLWGSQHQLPSRSWWIRSCRALHIASQAFLNPCKQEMFKIVPFTSHLLYNTWGWAGASEVHRPLPLPPTLRAPLRNALIQTPCPQRRPSFMRMPSTARRRDRSKTIDLPKEDVQYLNHWEWKA